MTNKLFVRRQSSDGDWISISDLMAGLMMIFLFIAISFMNSLQRDAENIRQMAVAYQELQDDLYEELLEEFREDLDGWQATIDRESLAVRFTRPVTPGPTALEPELLFAQGSANLTPRFSTILEQFFDRYITILYSEKYRDDIDEIRIEGHTSSEWQGDTSEDIAYFENMRLSQERTRVVLQECLALIEGPAATARREWAQQFITANGLSSSQLISDDEGNEDPERSRRVEFRTKTAAERRIVQIVREFES